MERKNKFSVTGGTCVPGLGHARKASSSKLSDSSSVSTAEDTVEPAASCLAAKPQSGEVVSSNGTRPGQNEVSKTHLEGKSTGELKTADDSRATMGEKPKGGSKKVPWTALEDSRLRSIIQANIDGKDRDGKINISMTWGEIADLIPHRTAKQCRERWCYNLDPTINHSSWNVQEDAILLKAQKQFSNQWAMIAKYLPGRTENAVKTRYKSVMRAKKREWKRDEDQAILKLVAQYGSKWDIIKKHIPNRTANAIKTRYSNLKKGLTSANEAGIAGAARQVWLQPTLIDTIDLETLVKKPSQRNLHKPGTPVTSSAQRNASSLAQSIQLMNQLPAAKRLRLNPNLGAMNVLPVLQNANPNLSLNTSGANLNNFVQTVPVYNQLNGVANASNVGIVSLQQPLVNVAVTQQVPSQLGQVQQLPQPQAQPQQSLQDTTNEKVIQGFKQIGEAFSSDPLLVKEEKDFLVQQTNVVLANFVQLKKEKLQERLQGQPFVTQCFIRSPPSGSR